MIAEERETGINGSQGNLKTEQLQRQRWWSVYCASFAIIQSLPQTEPKFLINVCNTSQIKYSKELLKHLKAITFQTHTSCMQVFWSQIYHIPYIHQHQTTRSGLLKRHQCVKPKYTHRETPKYMYMYLFGRSVLLWWFHSGTWKNHGRAGVG